jgi:hypothetical protein
MLGLVDLSEGVHGLPHGIAGGSDSRRDRRCRALHGAVEFEPGREGLLKHHSGDAYTLVELVDTTAVG